MLVIHSLTGGGAQRVARYLIERLDRSLFELRLVLFSTAGEDFAGLGLESAPASLGKRSRWSFPAMAIRLRRLLRDWRPDVVLSFLDVTNILVVLASVGRRRHETVVNERNFPRERLSRRRLGRFKLRLLKWAYRRADRVLCNSRATAGSLTVDFGVAADRVTTIYNPVPVDRIRDLAAQEVRHAFFQDGGIVVMGLGRLADQKRFDLLLRAFAEVRKTELRPVFLIVLGEGPCRRELEALSENMGIAEWVDLPGYRDNPYPWLNRATVFVLSSDYEGFPNVVLEAMACGVPVVATDCPSGPNEIIAPGTNGDLVPVGDHVAMAKAIQGLLSDGDKRERYAAAACERLQDYRLDEIVKQYEAMLGLGGTE